VVLLLVSLLFQISRPVPMVEACCSVAVSFRAFQIAAMQVFSSMIPSGSVRGQACLTRSQVRSRSFFHVSKGSAAWRFFLDSEGIFLNRPQVEVRPGTFPRSPPAFFFFPLHFPRSCRSHRPLLFMVPLDSFLWVTWTAPPAWFHFLGASVGFVCFIPPDNKSRFSFSMLASENLWHRE